MPTYDLIDSITRALPSKTPDGDALRSASAADELARTIVGRIVLHCDAYNACIAQMERVRRLGLPLITPG